MQKMVLLPYDRYERLVSAKGLNHAPSSEESDARQDNESVHPEPSVELEEPETNTTMTDDIESVVSSFPKKLKSRARSLLTYISPSVTWNAKGEVTIEGVNIPGSNIVDLVKVQLKDYKDLHPIGLDKFSDILKDINVPLSLLTSSRRVQTGQGILPPPPGSPVKRKRKDIPKRRAKWLRL